MKAAIGRCCSLRLNCILTALIGHNLLSLQTSTRLKKMAKVQLKFSLNLIIIICLKIGSWKYDLSDLRTLKSGVFATNVKTDDQLWLSRNNLLHTHTHTPTHTVFATNVKTDYPLWVSRNNVLHKHSFTQSFCYKCEHRLSTKIRLSFSRGSGCITRRKFRYLTGNSTQVSPCFCQKLCPMGENVLSTRLIYYYVTAN